MVTSIAQTDQLSHHFRFHIHCRLFQHRRQFHLLHLQIGVYLSKVSYARARVSHPVCLRHIDPKPLTGSHVVVETPTQVALVLIKTLAHVALAGRRVFHRLCLAAAAHCAPGLLLDLQRFKLSFIHSNSGSTSNELVKVWPGAHGMQPSRGAVPRP